MEDSNSHIATITGTIAGILNNSRFEQAVKMANQAKLSDAMTGIQTAKKIAAAKFAFVGILAGGFADGSNGAFAAALGAVVGSVSGPVAGALAAEGYQTLLDKISQSVLDANVGGTIYDIEQLLNDPEFWDYVEQNTDALFEPLFDILTSTEEAAKEIAESIQQTLQETVLDVTDTANDFWQEVIEKKEALDQAIDSAQASLEQSTLDSLLAITSTLNDGIEAADKAISDFWQATIDAPGNISDAIDQFQDSFEKNLLETMLDFHEAMGDAVDAVSDFIEQLPADIANILDEIKDWTTNAFIEIAGDIGDIINSIENGVHDAFQSALDFVFRRDPLVLDLDGDGIETTPADGSVLFDHNANEQRTATGWIAPDDGLLVLDRDGNGTIDNGRELFGDNTLKSNGELAINGFDALADLDTNQDGLFDSNDAEFANVRVWQDVNQDGISQSNELFTLDQLNIESIGTGGAGCAIRKGKGALGDGLVIIT